MHVVVIPLESNGGVEGPVQDNHYVSVVPELLGYSISKQERLA